MKFRIRIDGNNNDEQIEQWFKLHTKEYVIVHHKLPHGNPHYHVYADDPMMMSIDAMRQRVKRYFKPEKRSDYSVKNCEDGREDEYISYMFNTKHGNESTHIASNVGCERISKCLLAAKEVSDDFERRKTERKSKGVTIYDIARIVAERVSHNDDVTIEEYTKITIDTLHSYRKTCEPNMLIKIVATARSLKTTGFLVQKVQNYFQER